jgi:hypothetical protein
MSLAIWFNNCPMSVNVRYVVGAGYCSVSHSRLRPVFEVNICFRPPRKDLMKVIDTEQQHLETPKFNHHVVCGNITLVFS